MYLEKILQHKKREVARAQAERDAVYMKRRALESPPPRGFKSALERCGEAGALIAEIKRASPSRGDIRPSLDPAALARCYQEGGAAALSVLTERCFFKGSLEDLRAARGSVELPVLRKDFILEEWQLYESRAAGADAVLLIAGVLPAPRLRELVRRCREMLLQPLIEVSNEREMEAALEAGADLLGINNRDLQSFREDLEKTVRMASLVPPGVLLVGESGIRSRGDVEKMQRAGAGAVLVGETLVRSSDPAAKVRELGGYRCG